MSGIAERLALPLHVHLCGGTDHAYAAKTPFCHMLAQVQLPVVEREIAAARGEVVARVESLHFRRPWSNFPHGDMVTFGQTEFPDQCNHCRVAWPCRTSAALSPDPDRGEGEGAHDCESCADCLHDGVKCCGCYDGACCQRDDA